MRMRSESEFVLFPLVRQGTGRGGGPRPRLSDPLPVGAARGVVSCRGKMLLLPALHPEKWRWGAIRSERRSEGPACLLAGLMMAVARGRILSRPLVRCGRPAAHHATTRHRPRRSSRRPPTPPCRLSSSNVPKQRSRPRVAVALRQPYPRRRLPSTDARRRHLVRRTDGRVAPIRLVHRQSCVPVGAKQARNACRYRPGQLARRGRPRARRPPSEPRGADCRPPAADADARAARVPPPGLRSSPRLRLVQSELLVVRSRDPSSCAR